MVERILTVLFATYADILTSYRSTVAHAFRFGADTNAPLPTPPSEEGAGPATSVPCLSPGKFSAQGSLTSELLRFL